MAPALQHGQLVLARPCNKYVTNDIVIFTHGGMEKIKRIVSITGNSVSVRGDNSDYSTDSRSFGPISSDDILGKVIWPVA